MPSDLRRVVARLMAAIPEPPMTEERIRRDTMESLAFIRAVLRQHPGAGKVNPENVDTHPLAVALNRRLDCRSDFGGKLLLWYCVVFAGFAALAPGTPEYYVPLVRQLEREGR